MSDANSYILGTDDEELARLRLQHKAWVEAAYAVWRRAGLRAGQCVLDLGCGPGFTSFELAQVVGSQGRVVARDASSQFLEFLKSERERRGDPVEPSLGLVEELDFEANTFDAAYARWLFCWLPDPVEAMSRVAASVRPGGAVILQEYINWATMSLVPREALFDEVVACCMQSWHDGGGQIDVSNRVPEMARATGMRIEHFAPLPRLGAVGSLEWRWLGGFFESYLPRLVQRGRMASDQHADFLALWNERSASGFGFVVAPTVADVVLRKEYGS